MGEGRALAVSELEQLPCIECRDERKHSYLISPDHDLLIEVNARLQTLHSDLQTKVTQLQQDLALLRASSASSVTVSDHEVRLRKLERYYWMGIGVVLAAEIALRLLLK